MSAKLSPGLIATATCGVIAFLAALFLVRGLVASYAGKTSPVPHSTPDNTPKPEPTEAELDAPLSEIVTTRGLALAATRPVTPEERERMHYGDWASKDPQAAFDAVMALFEQEGSYDTQANALLDIVIIACAETNPDLAIELGRLGDTSGYDNYYIEEILAIWPEERFADVPAILMEMKKTEVPESGGGASLYGAEVMASRWPADDSENLLGWLALLLAGTYGSDESIPDLMGERRFDDIAFINSIPENPPEARLLALKAVAQHDPNLGLQAIDFLAADQRADAICFVAGRLFETDRDAAVQLLAEEQLVLIDEEHSLYIEVEDSSFLFESIEYGIEEEKFSAEEMRGLPISVQREVGMDVPIQEEAQWIATLDGSEHVTARAYELSQRWAEAEPQAAGEWITAMEPGPTRDHAIAGFVRSVAAEDPAAGAEWADAISDPALRERFMRVALRRWQAIDPDAAAEAIRNSDLSDTAVESLIGP